MSRPEGLALRDADCLRVDTCQAAPADMGRFVTMNPFHFDPRWRIPVPGTAEVSCSLENVWQALKIVDGRTDLALLRRPAEKRPPERLRGPGFDYQASRLSYAGRPTDLVTARYLIYLPSYLYLLDRLVPDPVVGEITTALAAGREVVFYDWDDNHDIEDPRTSFSHSAILAAWFGGRLEEVVERRDRWLASRRDSAPSPTPPLLLNRYRRIHRR